MRKHRRISLLAIFCVLPVALTGCGIRYAVHDHHHGYKKHRPYKHYDHHHGHRPPPCRSRPRW